MDSFKLGKMNGSCNLTRNAYLCTKAKQAAETTHFDAVPTAPLKSKGRMVFVF
jgi:hypothetical protein